MLFLFVLTDLVGSSARLALEGEAIAGPERQARMDVIESAFVAEGLKRVGLPAGDGWFLVGPPEVTVAAYQRALALQAVEHRLLTKIGMSVGPGMWTGEPWSPAATIRSSVLDFTGRLRDGCPPGGVAVNAGVHVVLSSVPALRAALSEGTKKIKGFERERFWIHAPAGVGAKVTDDNGDFRSLWRAVEELRSTMERLIGEVHDLSARMAKVQDVPAQLVPLKLVSYGLLGVVLLMLGGVLRGLMK